MLIYLKPKNYYEGTEYERLTEHANVSVDDNGLEFYETDTSILYRVCGGAWLAVSIGSGGGIPEPVDDAAVYGRSTDTGVSSWVEVVPKTGGEYTGGIGIKMAPTHELDIDGTMWIGSEVNNRWVAFGADGFGTYLAAWDTGDRGLLNVYTSEFYLHTGTTFSSENVMEANSDGVGFGITPTVPLHVLGDAIFQHGFGYYLEIEDTGGAENRVASRGAVALLSPMDISAQDLSIKVGTDSGVGTTALRVRMLSGATRIGFYGTTPVIQQTGVTASTALENYGLGTSLIAQIPEPSNDSVPYLRRTVAGTSSWIAGVPATGGTFGGAVTVNGAFIVNDTAADVDSRIEGTSDPNLTYWDAGNNNIGIGTPTPAAAAKLHVVGNTYFERSLASLSTLNRFYNPDMTDGNGIVLNFDTDTTGTGATVQQQMVQIAVQFDTHNHTTRSARILFRPTVGGSFKNPAVGIANGMVIGTPTGGYKGDGTINAQNGVYDNNTLLTDHIFDLHYDGRMRPADKERFPDARLWNIEETAEFTKQNRHLPTMPGRLQWETAGGDSLGRLVTALWETVEQQQIMIFELDEKIKAVKNGR